jgi:hypothetical protein
VSRPITKAKALARKMARHLGHRIGNFKPPNPTGLSIARCKHGCTKIVVVGGNAAISGTALDQQCEPRPPKLSRGGKRTPIYLKQLENE